MHKASHSMDRVERTLRRLEQYRTVSPFCRMFYRLIYSRLGSGGADAATLRRAFALFLRNEVRRHDTVLKIVARGRVDLPAVLRVGNATHHALVRISGVLERMELPGVPARILRELLLAECHFHLGRTEQVIEALRRAVALGGRHPLVFFALGYNLYTLAVQRYTVEGSGSDELMVVNPEAFETAGRKAIDVLRRGLGGPRFDAQVHWWIGLIADALGERDEAREAFRQAMEADPDNFTELATTKLEALDASRTFVRSAEEAKRLARLGPITDDTLREARRELDEGNWPSRQNDV